MGAPAMTQRHGRRGNTLTGLALASLVALAACGRDASQTDAKQVTPAPTTAPTTKESTAPGLSAVDSIALADGSFLNFRSSINRQFDKIPLKDVEVIRVLVNYNRTNFFVSQNQPKGFEYEYLLAFERFLNQRLHRTDRPIRFEFVITDFDRLLPDLIEGRGEIAAGNLTITPARAEKVNFSLPYLTNVDEAVVMNRNAPAITSLNDLAGERVLVVRGSSYAEHMRRLAAEQKKTGRKPVEILEPESSLESEDILEMVNAGIVDYTVADSHRARLWSQILPNIVVLDIVLNEGGSIAWATRRESRELRAALDDFVRYEGARSSMNRTLFQRYFRDTRWITNPNSGPHQRQQSSIIDQIKKQSSASGLDWRLVMAHAAAHSDFDQSRKGPSGAVGIMQVTPEMAAAVGVSDIEKPDENIRAGVRYLAKLRDDFARESGADADASVDLALAAYNVGPEMVQTLQKYAADLGLNPKLWQRNVELVADLTLGEEPGRRLKEVHQYQAAYMLNPDNGRNAPVRP